MSRRGRGVYGIGNHVPLALCPHCGKEHDRAGRHDTHKPEPGGVGLCNWCLAVNIYDERLQLRPPTAEEKAELDADPEIRAMQRYVATLHAQGWDIHPPISGTPS